MTWPGPSLMHSAASDPRTSPLPPARSLHRSPFLPQPQQPQQPRLSPIFPLLRKRNRQLSPLMALSATEQALVEQVRSLAWDPLGFVMFAYPWEHEPSIQLVQLPEPWRSRYSCTWGPDKWACESLEQLP